MRLLLLDPFHGASGDMIVGALLDCCADRELVVRAMRSVVADPGIAEVTRCGMRALKVETRATTTHRTLEEVLARCDQADAPPEVLAMARRVFARIGSAEERVHGGHAHFHEVGADDAVADVIGACMAHHILGVDGVAVLPITMSRGTILGTHGTYPIPAPATMDILKGTGLTMRISEEDVELCTPTGAALLAEFITEKEPDLGTYSILVVGYGAGSRDPPDTPNVLRAMIVETEVTGMMQDFVDVLETTVDDVSGEVIAHTITRLMEAGARDASAIPSIMKKGRAGHLVRVICTENKSAELARLMALELGTLGIRCTGAVHRFIADRTTENVEVVFNGQRRMLPVKCGWIGGRVYTLKAEFEPAQMWAAELDVPVRDVLQAVNEAGWHAVRQRGGTRHEK
ncbi:MAG: nickel pincer cofactor biosynthesis protein LarC [Methanoregula sp.]|nr:nickel pincer cofactor biosynthesis protein LarC [Methanoregula sp.]